MPNVVKQIEFFMSYLKMNINSIRSAKKTATLSNVRNIITN